MPFDANLVLLDGLTTITASNDDAPTTLTRTNSAIVLDIKETGVRGLVAVAVFPADLTAGSDDTTFSGYIQCSDALAFDSVVENHGYFGVALASEKIIIGSECPCVAMVRFATKKRYVRANFTVSATFGAPIILLSQYPFDLL